jgi:ABC-type lipoprotein release transport system permease subunit
MWYEALSTIGWVYVGIVIGGMSMMFAISILNGSKQGDLESEILDLRVQRQLLKEEIFRLSKPKPKPRQKRRPYRRQPKKTN